MLLYYNIVVLAISQLVEALWFLILLLVHMIILNIVTGLKKVNDCYSQF